MKTIDKVLNIMEAFLDSDNEEISLSEIEKLTGMNKPIISNFLESLVNRGYIIHTKLGKYSLGTKMLFFSARIKRRFRLREMALPYLTKLWKLTNESVILVMYDGENAFCMEVINSPHPLNFSIEEGIKVPLHCSSVGKIILADKSDDELDLYFSIKHLVRRTQNTITELNILKSQLRLISAEKIAYDDEESFDGIRSVASGIRDSNKSIIGCVSIAGPITRLNYGKIAETKPEIKLCAMEISMAFGFTGN